MDRAKLSKRTTPGRVLRAGRRDGASALLDRSDIHLDIGTVGRRGVDVHARRIHFDAIALVNVDSNPRNIDLDLFGRLAIATKRAKGK